VLGPYSPDHDGLGRVDDLLAHVLLRQAGTAARTPGQEVRKFPLIWRWLLTASCVAYCSGSWPFVSLLPWIPAFSDEP
jgi:hypothetical protein